MENRGWPKIKFRMILSLLILVLMGQLYWSQNKGIMVIERNGKFGVRLDSLTIIPAKYEFIKKENGFIAGKQNNRFDLYSNSGVVIRSGIRKYFVLKWDDIQMLNSDNRLEYTDSLGTKLEKEDYYHYGDLPNVFEIATEIDTVKNRINYLSKNSATDTIVAVQYHKDVQKKIKLVALMNNRYLQYHINGSYFPALHSSYVVIKNKNRFGVWNFDKEEIILPCVYDKITAYNTHLILQKDGLYTIYPNFGRVAQYRNIEPFEYYLARFENVEGKKGWIDRNGVEYDDE